MPDRNPTFTILMPVHRAPDFMPYALSSVLNQNRKDFELFIVCDGAPQATVDLARATADTDHRVKVFAFPKGERNGEAHRHTALAQASGQFCCQIADDDLWFPHHLDEIEQLLTAFEFGNLLHVYAADEDRITARLFDLADPHVQQRMQDKQWNFFGPTVAGFHLETYRRLPSGWSPAPVGLWTDLAMWRKFLALPDIVAGSRITVTSLHFPATMRQGWSTERRLTEIKRHAGALSSPDHLDRIAQQALLGAARESTSGRASGKRRNGAEVTDAADREARLALSLSLGGFERNLSWKMKWPFWRRRKETAESL